MSTIWTDDEFSEFEALTAQLVSRDQMDRIEARLALPKFVQEHGEEKCDAMFSEIQRRDAALAMARKER